MTLLRNLSRSILLLLILVLLLTVLPVTVASAAQTEQAEMVTVSQADLAMLRTSLASGVEVLGKKPALPRLLPSDTSVKAVGLVTCKDLPLYFKDTDDSSIYMYLPKNAVVSVLEDCDERLCVSYNNCTGYADAASVELLKRNTEFICYGVVDTEELSVYASCEDIDEHTVSVATLSGGTRIEVVGFSHGWFAIKSGDIEGFVSGDSLDLTLEKEAPKAKKPAVKKTSTEETVVTNGSGSDIASYALQFVGVPYRYGGASPDGFDCSGFTRYVFAHFGVTLPHGASPQLNCGAEVSRENLQSGDLVFFHSTYATSSPASHCGIYIGGGQFVHSASGGNRGITVSNLSDSYYSRHYLTARRIPM